MKKTKVGNIEITIDPEPKMVFLDDHIKTAIHWVGEAGAPETSKEPGRARKIYNRLKEFLK